MRTRIESTCMRSFRLRTRIENMEIMKARDDWAVHRWRDFIERVLLLVWNIRVRSEWPIADEVQFRRLIDAEDSD